MPSSSSCHGNDEVSRSSYFVKEQRWSVLHRGKWYLYQQRGTRIFSYRSYPTLYIRSLFEENIHYVKQKILTAYQPNAKAVLGNISLRSWQHGPRSVRTATTSGKYRPVRLSRLVSKRLILLQLHCWNSYEFTLRCFQDSHHPILTIWTVISSWGPSLAYLSHVC